MMPLMMGSVHASMITPHGDVNGVCVPQLAVPPAQHDSEHAHAARAFALAGSYTT